jgi:hypothetical protein
MNRLAVLVSLALAIIASPAALADDVAAERARLANDRILAEEERRAREAAEQAERLQVEQAQAGKQAPSAEANSPPPADRIEMSRALEQLRELGSLKDAGYLTDEEFQLLKKKILDGAL